MAIDLNKMRSKLEALQNRGEKKDSSFWRPEDGEQTIRIVPTAASLVRNVISALTIH